MTDFPTVTESAPPIDPNSITGHAARDVPDALDDDDQRWLSTVLASLPERSPEARTALAEALIDGHPIAAPVGCANFLIPSRTEQLSHAGDAAHADGLARCRIPALAIVDWFETLQAAGSTSYWPSQSRPSPHSR